MSSLSHSGLTIDGKCQLLLNSKQLPFINTDLSKDDLQKILSALKDNDKKLLGFNPQTRSTEGIQVFKDFLTSTEPKPLTVITSIKSFSEALDWARSGVDVVCYAGNLEDVRLDLLPRKTVFIPIANSLGEIQSKVDWLNANKLAPILKIYILDEDSKPIAPEVVAQVKSKHSQIQLIVFGGINDTNAQHFLNAGASLLGINVNRALAF